MDITILLQRSPYAGTIQELMSFIEKTYPTIGRINSYNGIFEGYEDANLLLETTTGKYVVKAFGDFRTEKNITDYVKVIIEATKKGVLTIEIISGIQGNISSYSGGTFMITRFFEGINFVDVQPTRKDILSVTKSLALLNTLNFDIDESYDSWGNKNLLKEFTVTPIRSPSVIHDVGEIVKMLKCLSFDGFSRGVIHGDMQKKHVLKHNETLCIIDFGCMSFDYIVYELSTFLAWFCIDSDRWNEKESITADVIATYSQHRAVSAAEVASLPLLITSSYAAYYLKTTELIERGDSSLETQEWHNSAKELFYKAVTWLTDKT